MVPVRNQREGHRIDQQVLKEFQRVLAWHVRIPPALQDWAMLVALGVLGGARHGLLVQAYARAPVSLLAPLSYTQRIWSGLAGILVFADWPDGWTLLGAAIIAAGGVMVAVPDRRRAAPSPG